MAYYRADATAEEMRNYESWRMTDDFHLFDPMELLKLKVQSLPPGQSARTG
jgi:hypothetical protein